MRTAILSWLQNDRTMWFSVDQLKGNNFHQVFLGLQRTLVPNLVLLILPADCAISIQTTDKQQLVTSLNGHRSTHDGTKKARTEK